MGRRISGARHDAGYARAEDFAKELGVSASTVYSWESPSKQKAPRDGNLRKIAELTGRSVNYLRYGNEEAPQEKLALALDRARAELEDLRSQLPPPDAPPPAKAMHHPGVEALAADAETCEDNAVKPEELDRLRRMVCDPPIRFAAEALAVILARLPICLRAPWRNWSPAETWGMLVGHLVSGQVHDYFMVGVDRGARGGYDSLAPSPSKVREGAVERPGAANTGAFVVSATGAPRGKCFACRSSLPILTMVSRRADMRAGSASKSARAARTRASGIGRRPDSQWLTRPQLHPSTSRANWRPEMPLIASSSRSSSVVMVVAL